MKKREALGRALPWFALAAAYALSVAFIARCGMHNLNADDASEMVLASLLNREGALLSRSWMYSTELRVISPVPLYQLGLLLFPGSWHAARTCAIAVVMLLIAAAFLFMARRLGLRRAAPWICAALMLPLSATYAYVIIYRCYYAMHLVGAFLMLGLVARFGEKGLKRAGASLGVLAALGLLSGLGGVRMLTMIVIPLAGTALLLAACACKRYGTFRAAGHEPAVRMLGASLAIVLPSAAGYLVNMLVLSRTYTFLDYSDVKLAGFEVSDFLHQLSNMVRDLGYHADVPLFSGEGLMSVLSVLIAAMMALALWRMAARWEALSDAHRLLTLTAVLAVVLGMVLNVLLQQYLSRYFIVGTILLLVVVGAALETEPCANGLLRGAAIVLVAGCLALQAVCTMRYDYTQGEVNYEMAADWLLENGYTQGYATFWNANVLAEASDGQIEMWVLEDGRRNQWMNLELHWLLETKEHAERDPQGRVFLLVDELENQVDAPLLDKGHLVGELVGWSYYIYGYESVDEMRALIGEGQ